jgi:hypothetical protein
MAVNDEICSCGSIDSGSEVGSRDVRAILAHEIGAGKCSPDAIDDGDNTVPRLLVCS